MPPKKQLSPNQILEKAFEMTRQYGYEYITTRKLSSELGCSTQPIYQAYADMNELKIALIKKAQLELNNYINTNSDSSHPKFLAYLLAYVDFASKEKRLYQLIFGSGTIDNENFHNLVPKEIGVELNMLIYVHGIVMMQAYNTLDFPTEIVKHLIIQAYYTFSKGDQNDIK